MAVLSLNFVADIKIIFGYNFVVPLIIRLYNYYNSVDLWNFNWLSKHIGKIRSSQDLALINSCTELKDETTFSIAKVGWMLSCFIEILSYLERIKTHNIKTHTEWHSANSGREKYLKLCPYLTFKSSNIKVWSTFAL